MKSSRRHGEPKSLLKFRDLLESLPDALVVVNGKGEIVLVNEQAVNLFGWPAEELMGRRVEALVPAQFRGAHVPQREAYVAHPRRRPMGAGLELHGLRKDGTQVPVEISLSPLETEEGSFVVSAIRDASERKRVQRTLEEKNLEMEKATRAKDRFLASMSHELRTPLNAIIGFTGTLLMELPGPLTREQRKQLETVKASAHHQLSLINDLLDLAKIESGKVTLKLEPVDCSAVFGEVAETLRPLAERKELAFARSIPAGVIAETDRRSLSQILINLTSNAIKFTRTGSVELELSQTKDRTGFSIRDTGPGMTAQEKAKLFDAFSRLESATGSREEGTGLGLHLSQKLAALLGGTISVETNVGKGSTFVLTLPRRRSAAS